MTPPPEDVLPTDVLQTIATLVREVVGEEWIQQVEISRETSFGDDLELESIEFVALAERVQQVWGERVDFVGWLAGMELDRIIGLTVGELVDYVESCLRS